MGNYSDSFLNKGRILSNLNIDHELFLHLAAGEYEKENYSGAAEILENNIKKFPSNTSAQILLSKTYAQLGKYQLAVYQLKSACERIHSTKTLNFYLQEIEGIVKTVKIDFDTDSSKLPDYKFSVQHNEEKFLPADESKSYETLLVSETLAKIYISQGELNEAIKIYEKLIDRKPENTEKYLLSIEELRSRLDKESI